MCIYIYTYYIVYCVYIYIYIWIYIHTVFGGIRLKSMLVSWDQPPNQKQKKNRYLTENIINDVPVPLTPPLYPHCSRWLSWGKLGKLTKMWKIHGSVKKMICVSGVFSTSNVYRRVIPIFISQTFSIYRLIID